MRRRRGRLGRKECVCAREMRARVSGVGRRECLSKYALTTGGQNSDGGGECQSTKKQLCKIRGGRENWAQHAHKRMPDMPPHYATPPPPPPLPRILSACQCTNIWRACSLTGGDAAAANAPEPRMRRRCQNKLLEFFPKLEFAYLA